MWKLNYNSGIITITIFLSLIFEKGKIGFQIDKKFHRQFLKNGSIIFFILLIIFIGKVKITFVTLNLKKNKN
jgi:hypothetical protein